MPITVFPLTRLKDSDGSGGCGAVLEPNSLIVNWPWLGLPESEEKAARMILFNIMEHKTI